MDKREWLRREIGAWRDEGIVTEETAEALMRRYQPTERRFSWGVMIAGGFGALMIGLGVIALFAANWDCFGRPVRAAISLTPVVLCGIAALVASAKGWKSMALWEPLGILWCIATAAGTCLVAQTYQVGGSVPGLILFVALLMLPAVWISRSVMAMALWPILAIVWTFAQRDIHPSSFALGFEGLGLMALSLPAYLVFIRREPGKVALVTGQLVTGFVYSLGAAILLLRAWPLGWNHSNASVLIFWGCSAMIAGAAAVFKLPVWPIVATLVASGAAMVTGVDRDSSLYVVSLVLALGVLAYGVRKLKLSYANIGAALLLWLILAKFFASHLDFTVKGLVLILSGAAITVLNVVFIRLRKRSA